MTGGLPLLNPGSEANSPETTADSVRAKVLGRGGAPSPTGRPPQHWADPPFGDPARAHGTAMEGYYWRVVAAEAGSVIVVLCGVCRGAGEPWAAMALAAHPSGFTRHALAAPATAEPSRFGAGTGDILRGSADGVSIRLGEDACVDLRLRSALRWPGRVLGALGSAQVVPGLGQYWHPVVLATRADGEACLGGVRLRLDGATAYAEKNWGPGFAGHWWWARADAFPGGDVTVAFAGGRLGLAGRVVSPTAVVVRLGTQVLRFAPPLARLRAATAARVWQIRARTYRHAVEIEGEASDGAPHLLPVLRASSVALLRGETIGILVTAG